MKLEDRAEEILESLWVGLVENNIEDCDVGLLNDDESLKILSNKGYVYTKNRRVSLTSKGRDEAKNCIRRHRLAERLMADVLDVKGESVHENSCKMEHMLHKGLDENICTLLGHPATCPHGKPIPEGKCCKNMRKKPNKLIMPVTDLAKNKGATVAYIQTQEKSALQKMIAMGILPNVKIRVLQKFPSYVLQMGKSQFAVDKELAGRIFVRAA
jgi:DtxR family Mn-dependent transcriptional regulator